MPVIYWEQTNISWNNISSSSFFRNEVKNCSSQHSLTNWNISRFFPLRNSGNDWEGSTLIDLGLHVTGKSSRGGPGCAGDPAAEDEVLGRGPSP